MSDVVTVGEIRGRLTLDDSEWKSKIDRAKVDIDELTRDRTTRVRVDVDDAAALAALAALRAELDRLRNQPPIPIPVPPVPPGGGGAGAAGAGGPGGFGLMAPAIAAAITLIGPLTAAATAGLTQITGLAGTAGLGFLGLKSDMAQGTAEGVALTKQFHSIGGELGVLEQTAANALIGGVLGSLSQVKAELPSLNPLVKSLGSDLGQALSITTGGVITGLEAMRPILDEAGQGAINLAQDFANFTKSAEFKQFVAYAQQELPKVERDLQDIGRAGIQTVVALQPLGDFFLSVLDTTAKIVTAVTWLNQFGNTPGFSGLPGSSGPSASGALPPVQGHHSTLSLSPNHVDFLSRDATLGDFISEIGHGRPPVKPRKYNDTTGQYSTASADAQQVADSQAAAAAAATSGLSKLDAQYKLTTQQADALTGMLGLQSAQVTAGTVPLAAYAAALKTVENAENTASGAGSTFLTSLSTFASSGGTAADRASLIGATLKAANGDLLSYAASQAQAATANQQFVTDFDNARFAAQKAHTAFDGAVTGVVDLKTGSLNYHNAAAGPLIADLQQLQDAAAKAAGETYQHELATKGATQASADAVTQYQSQTAGSLVAEATQLGLTKDQAQKLADQYFGIKNIGAIKTLIQTEGTDPVVTVLDKIGGQLAYLTGHPWNVAVTQTIDTVGKFSATAADRANAPPVKKSAAGGPVTGSGPRGVDSVLMLGAPGEFMSTTSSTDRNAAALAAGNRGATLVAVPGYADGGFVGVTAPTNPNIAAAAAANKRAASTAKAATTAATTRGNIEFTINADVSKVLAAGTLSAVQSAVTSLTNAVHSGIVQGIGSNALVSQLQADNVKFAALATKRAADVASLSAATAKLTADEQKYSQEVTTVRSSVTSGFNLGQVASGLAGSFNPFGGAQPGTTAAGLLSALQSQVGSESSFGAGLIGLRKKGLNSALLQQLGEAGPSGAGSAVSALAGATGAQIAQFNALYAKSTAIGSSTGGLVAGSLFGGAIAADARAVGRASAKVVLDDKSAATLATALAKAVAGQLAGFGIRVTGTDKFSQAVKADIAANNVAIAGALARR